MRAHLPRFLASVIVLLPLWALAVPEVAGARAPGAPASFSCSTVTGISAAECQALAALYQSAGGPGWAQNGGWLSGTRPCSWAGITCRAGHVQKLILDSNYLSGTIPAELGNLTNMEVLDLSDNSVAGCELTGDIPPELGNLAHLQQLLLADTKISGSIPPQLGRLANLHDLDLDLDQLSGSIPPELGNLANLQTLSLQEISSVAASRHSWAPSPIYATSTWTPTSSAVTSRPSWATWPGYRASS